MTPGAPPTDLHWLEQAALFAGLEHPARLAALQAAQAARLEADQYLFMQEDPASHFYLVVEGKLKLSQVTVEGQQVIMAYSTPGEAVGVAAALALPGYPVSAQAVGPSRTLGWSRETAQRLMLAHPQIALNLVKDLAGHVVEYQNRLRELATERVERRIARTLLRLARQAGRKTQDGVQIDMPLTRQDLAELTGTTLYTVSRTLSQWEAQGLVLSRREQITIRKPHGLVTIAEDLA